MQRELVQVVMPGLKDIYPIYRLAHYVKNFVAGCQYHYLIKTNNIPLYDESQSALLHRELLAIELYRTLKESHRWLAVPVYPSGGAVDYKLLYVLGKSLGEYNFRTIIEFGAGQTTRILSSYAAETGASVLTVEHDEFWTSQISPWVTAPTHHITCRRLVHAPVSRQGSPNWYDSNGLGESDTDLFLVDGPVGTPRFSRIGFIDLFPSLCAEEWLVIWDDIHRYGDMESFVMFINNLRQRGVKFDCTVINGLKRIGLVYTPRFRGVGHYF